MATFKELLQSSLKSKDTEEWLDVHFTRPIGLVFALLWNKLGIHPNTITILSIFFGVGAGWMFYHTDLTHNIMGVVLLMLANFCDSTDGQMARLTGKKTLVGRVLDGASGDMWFLAIYVALCLRMQGQFIPGTQMRWGIWIWVLGILAGFLSHAPQAMLADYYRQIHLFFLKGKAGSELDSYAQQRAVYESTPKEQVLARLFYGNYAGYCRKQEKRTPKFQKFFAAWKEKLSSHNSAVLEPVRQAFLDGSRPMMTYANILSFNARAIILYITCLLNCPWIYFLFEITAFNFLYGYMHKSHENLCRDMTVELSKLPSHD
ncbi:CDP-alcohol phosphatidyltransferase family protein [Hallella bergensis]|uniref:CDP-alcohol phosphatidyltransferase family protein n=1 Tax=Hallella bergensis TaxID=242750 RepID=UPI0023F3B17C|nr:CDP-alcohol phosphatidyltransferase family protein [Hallella bergensis]